MKTGKTYWSFSLTGLNRKQNIRERQLLHECTLQCGAHIHPHTHTTTHTYIRTPTYIRTHTQTHPCTHTQPRTQFTSAHTPHTHTSAHTHTYICTHIHPHTHSTTHTHIRTHTQPRTHTSAHTHNHTHAHSHPHKTAHTHTHTTVHTHNCCLLLSCHLPPPWRHTQLLAVSLLILQYPGQWSLLVSGDCVVLTQSQAPYSAAVTTFSLPSVGFPSSLAPFSAGIVVSQ